MNIFEYIKSIFGFEDIRKTQEIEQKKKDANSITFSIDGFGKQWVYIELENTDSHSCAEFAKLLFDLNEGHYENSMLNLLVSLSKQHPNLAPSIENILANWGKMLTTSIKTNDEEEANIMAQSTKRPFIRPRNAFLGHNKQ